ncbi:hypothetical protein TVAG_130160 [Trichomonas vaginalis G3]|uniref:F5/8 type C domain-containing protein n=1 Tax=Trichomonas vaginalis (strain ATCC PRA-98 / G3) TaxID=412133 RepID=A2DIB2_TRIV3|nr:galactose-binding domain-like family [Trichomonas vaginalis G3]EAY19908.1 hypothetical protein TVAG_130160 [Trichomonas vaginalis G3]KAI5509958.1 galactose-binding domain-like family [Trichomonas vaginalis G3]|eukprot:XP_001580894.1 hypothetical protein [Trichomonas vaginalis G3]
MFFLFSVANSESKAGIFSKVYNDKIIVIDASGSSKQYINGTKQLTKPEYSIYPWTKEYDWCSNCGRSYDENPYITYSLQNKKIKISGYFVRCGCCYHGCCCEDDYFDCFDCCLYSWSLQISDDNRTWKEVHRVDKDDTMRRCNEKSYTLDKEYATKYIRLIQNDPCPGFPPCIAINKLEIYGDILNADNSQDDEFVSYHDDDDDVSIIGHISKNGRVIEN